MIANVPTNYRNPFLLAIGFHLLLIALLVTDTSSDHAVLTKEAQNTPGMQLPIASAPQPEIVKAVNIDSKQVMETVNRLKQEREQQKQAETKRQQDFNRQLEQAKQQRIQEQKQLAKLKDEANKIAIARKKQAEEEKKHLKELAEQKVLESKRIEELKRQKNALVKQQELEVKKLAELAKKKADEKLKADTLHAEQEKQKADAKEKAELAEKARAEQAQVAAADAERKKEQAAAAAKQLASENAERQAQMAGEVNKYKAMIVNAIGQHWILPDNVNASLSSQFRIRLAPNGAVLEVSLTRSSGDPILDRSAKIAIFKASPLPVPKDAETFNLFRDISLTVRPEQLRG